MRGEVARILESIEPFLPQLLLVRLSYLHIKLLSDKATETFYSAGDSAVDAAIHMVNTLDSKFTLANSSLFQHHFAGLATAALTLTLESDPQIAIDSLTSLRQYCESGHLSPAWSTSISRYIATRLEAHEANAGEASGHRANNQDGLRHLANAAVGTEQNPNDKKLDWDSVLGRGYLNLFQ